MSYTFLLGPEVESSAEFFSDIPAYVLSRSSPTAGASCSNDSATESCQGSPFGTTCEPSTGSRGEDGLMSSAEDSRAKEFRQWDHEPECNTKAAGFGGNSPEWLAKFDHDSYFWKTRQSCLTGGWETFSAPFSDWGMMRSGEYFPLVPSVPHIHERGCFYWHTPTANDHKPAGQSEMMQVEKWLSGEPIKNTYIRLRSLLAARCGRREPPNPEFLEWLMAWPIGFTAIEPLETVRFQQWSRSHGGL